MRRGTTPTITFKINTDLDLSLIQECWITLKDNLGAKEKTYTLSSITIDAVNKTLTVSMSQEDTLYFNSGNINVQVRIRMSNGLAYASEIKHIIMENVLKNGEI